MLADISYHGTCDLNSLGGGSLPYNRGFFVHAPIAEKTRFES